MSYSRYIRKFRILLDEAEKDFLNSCYNKTVSALWFAIENLLRAILIHAKGWVPERSGKLISVFYNFLGMKIPEKTYLIKLINSLYMHRKNADHRSNIYNAEKVREIYNKSKELIPELLNIAKLCNMDIEDYLN